MKILDNIEKYLNEGGRIPTVGDSNPKTGPTVGRNTFAKMDKKIIDHLFWVAGAFNTALNSQKQYEVVKANKDTRKKLKEIFSLLKKYRKD